MFLPQEAKFNPDFDEKFTQKLFEHDLSILPLNQDYDNKSTKLL